jgi:hypothetical protein
MQLHCKTCGKPIPAQDVNVKLAIAKCQACHAVFNFADDLGAPAEPRPVVPLPKGFTLDAWGPELTITRRWYAHGVWLLLFFCIFWDGFLVLWYSMAAAAVMSGETFAIIMLVVPVLHVAVGVGLTYLVFCMFLNRSIIRVASGELSVRHGPLPWPGNRQMFTSDVKQLFCSETRRSSKHGCQYNFNVEVLKRDGTKDKLLEGLEDLEQALFIEQQIEQHLKIVDERVPGEVRV